MTALRFLIAPSLAGGMLAGLACGCATRGEAAIPVTANVLASGNGHLEAAAPREGTFYVYDSTANRIVYSGAVQGGDRVVVDPGSNLVTINGKTVTEAHLSNDHNYKIEFDHP